MRHALVAHSYCFFHLRFPVIHTLSKVILPSPFFQQGFSLSRKYWLLKIFLIQILCKMLVMVMKDLSQNFLLCYQYSMGILYRVILKVKMTSQEQCINCFQSFHLCKPITNKCLTDFSFISLLSTHHCACLVSIGLTFYYKEKKRREGSKETKRNP